MMRSGEVNPPLDPETFRRVFYDQLRRFQELFREEMRRHGKPLDAEGSPISLRLAFVEELMLCPTEEAALARIRRDLESARIVYILAGDVGRAFDAAYAQFLIQATRDQTPFFALASVVRVKLQATIDAEGKDYRL